MIAVGILAAVTLVAALVVVPVARESRLRREVGTASTASRRVLEKIQATSFSSIVSTYPPGHVEPIPGLNAGRLTISYVDPTADPLEIQVDLSWDSPEVGAMARTFNTMRTE